MKEFTKKERHAIYKLAKYLYTGKVRTRYICRFLCLAIRVAVGMKYMDGEYADIEISENTFPELYSMKPKDVNMGQPWFDTNSERLSAINACIKETA